MCPAFSVQKSRVDEVVKRKEGNNGPAIGAMNPNGGGGIRLPPGMKGRENL